MKSSNFGIFALIASAMMLGGCATSTLNYNPPKSVVIENSKVVSKSFDATWDSLVRQLSTDFFVINNIDKSSRLINISFSSQKPSDFVDCGSSVRTFKNARGEQRYDYMVSDSNAFTTMINDSIAANVERKTRLEGRTNIYVAPEGVGTVVTVNTKYVVNVTANVNALNGASRSDNYTWDFSTKQGQTGEVQCYATGAIERRILSLVGD